MKSNCSRLVPPNGTNLGFFKINFSTLVKARHVLKLVLKIPRFVPFGGEFDPIWMSNLTSLLIRGGFWDLRLGTNVARYADNNGTKINMGLFIVSLNYILTRRAQLAWFQWIILFCNKFLQQLFRVSQQSNGKHFRLNRDIWGSLRVRVIYSKIVFSNKSIV